MNALSPSLAAESANAWAERCLEHARRESAFWLRVLTVLRPLHQALSQGKWGALTEATGVQDALAQECDDLRAARRKLRDELGAALSVSPAGLTLAEIARRLPEPARQRLLALRAELKSRADNVHRLGEACARLAQHHVDFIQRFFTDLTGGGEGTRYGPAGTLRPASCRSLIQARG